MKIKNKLNIILWLMSALLMTQITLPMIQAEEAVSSDVSESEATEEKDESEESDIYDYEAMENLDMEPLAYSEYESLEDIVYELLAKYGLDASQIGLAYTNLQTDEAYYLNEDEQFIVASMYKVPMVAMFIDLINQGYLTWDSELPYSEEYYQDGAGEITANPKQAYYRLEDLAYQAIVYSDNTASLILYYYYVNNFGSFRTGLLDFVDFYEVPEVYYSDNYGSAYMMNLSLQKIATDDTYVHVRELMMQSSPKQLFSLFVNDMATKYGRYENMLNDSGIFYQDDEPIYTLVVMVSDDLYADMFIAELNLRVNEWTLAQAEISES
ncbi:serine hydrolase [Ruoffia tabacinasalis]|uniref:Serine hydrolase n=1 Tax=Ruoffia tabacinasalis TaxID=87458 RepID=A0ABS0LII0_9LACT|nr:serine hydrolase [Ruoffia tabacinasalis]MBG9978024.1 serine hydrolase [Ruoffia tabacinasalis]